MEYIKRTIEEKIIEASGFSPVIMLCGPTMAGKKTMLRRVMEETGRLDVTYVSLRDADKLKLATEDPDMFFERYHTPLVIEHIQLVPSLLSSIQYIVDEKRASGESCCGMFWLTGTAKILMMKNVTESLAGRCVYFNLSFLSAAELDGRSEGVFDPEIENLKARMWDFTAKPTKELFDRIYRGGIPALYESGDTERNDFFSDYKNLYLMRDVLEYIKVEKIPDFQSFLSYMASYTGQELNYYRIGQDLKISSHTAKKWADALEALGIICVIPPYFDNGSKRVVGYSKFYFTDTGFAAYLCGFKNADEIRKSRLAGQFFETYVVSEIVKSYYNTGKALNLYRYRDTAKREIDLLIVTGNKIYPVDIRMNRIPYNPDKNLSALDKYEMDIQPAVVICLTDIVMPCGKKTWLYPASAL